VQNPNNKANVLNYLKLGTSWMNGHDQIPANFMIILGGLFRDAGEAVELTAIDATHVHDLACPQHEEADTRIFAHVAYSVRTLGHQQMLVQATDTDVVLMCIYYRTIIPGMKELWVDRMGVCITTYEIAKALATVCHCESDVISCIGEAKCER
jgi:hypothetical protein